MQRVDQIIQEAMDSPMMGWSMSNILKQVEKEGLDVAEAKAYILSKYYK
tara:strand:- start:109 stop:255 length:147 start_codon:yes stop_codon:yes gene_type:complete